jgi:tetratricopeptide (TPR) repeat protein
MKAYLIKKLFLFTQKRVTRFRAVCVAKKICSFLLSMACFFGAIPTAASVHVASPQSDFAGNLHEYMWANYHQFGRNAQQAYTWYNVVLNNSSSLYTYKGYIHFLAETGNYAAIVQLMPRTNSAFEADSDIQLIFARALRSTNDKKRADELIISLATKFKNNVEIVYEAVQVYVERKELENALLVMDEVLNNSPKKPNFFIFHFLKAQIFAQLQKYPEADINIQRCLEAHPNFDKCWLLHGVIKEQQGDIQNAIKGYSSYIATTNTPDKRIEQHLMALTMRANINSGGAKKGLLVAAGSGYERALSLFKDKQYTKALELINDFLNNKQNQDSDNSLVQAQLVKVQILFALKEYAQATTCLVEWLEKNPQDTQLYAALHLLARTGAPINLVVNAFEHMHQKADKQVWPAVYLADLYTRMGKSVQALKYHERSLALTQDAELLGKVRLHIGLINYEAGQYDAMRQQLEKIESHVAAYGPAANLLAYYYVAHNKDHTKGQEWLDRAAKTSFAQNPHLLDTQALLYYKKGNYDQALALLKKVAEQAPQDALVLIHLAKAHDKKGDKQAALDAAKRAQQYAYSAYEKDTAQKLLTRLSQK